MREEDSIDWQWMDRYDTTDGELESLCEDVVRTLDVIIASLALNVLTLTAFLIVS